MTMTFALARYARRLVVGLGMVMLLFATLSAPALGVHFVDPDLFGSTNPDTSMTYRYYGASESPGRHWPPGSAYRSRFYDARARWSADAGGYAGFGITYSSSSGNVVGWGYSSDLNGALAHIHNDYNSGDQAGADLHVNADITWYTNSNGQVQNSGQRHFSGVVAHEIGHWVGLDDCSSTPHTGPDGERLTMCFGSPSWTQRHLQFTPSQGDIQGTMWVFGPQQININETFADCGAGAWDCTPDYYNFTPGSSHWWGSGTVSLNNNASVPYPEIYQEADGNHVDQDNDGRFRLSARVQAKDNQINPRAVVFIRWGSGSNEHKCDSGTLTVGTWATVTCNVDLPNSTNYEFQFGVRVTEKIDIAWIDVRDLD